MSRENGQFKPGQSGNPKGRLPNELCLTNIMKEHLEAIPEGKERSNKQMFVDKVYVQAMEGDTTCQKMIWNYMDGMPKQSITYEGDPPVSPLAIEIKGLRDDKNTDSGATDVKPKTS